MTQQDLQRSIYFGQLIWNALNEKRGEVTDPAKAQAFTNLINNLATQVLDIQTVDALNIQSRMGAEALIDNVRQIEKGVSRIVNALLPAVANSLMVKAAAAQQAALTSAMASITQSAQETMIDTAKQVRQVSVRTAEMQNSTMISPVAIETACNEFLAAADEVEAIRSNAERNARVASNALSELSGKMRTVADPLTEQRHALEK